MSNSFQITFQYLRDSHGMLNQSPPGAAMPALHPAPSTQPSPPPTPTPWSCHACSSPCSFYRTYASFNTYLLSYFVKTWIGAPSGGRILPPKCSLNMWNVHDRSSTRSTRTSNSLEAFHHSFPCGSCCQP